MRARHATSRYHFQWNELAIVWAMPHVSPFGPCCSSFALKITRPLTDIQMAVLASLWDLIHHLQLLPFHELQTCIDISTSFFKFTRFLQGTCLYESSFRFVFCIAKWSVIIAPFHLNQHILSYGAETICKTHPHTSSIISVQDITYHVWYINTESKQTFWCSVCPFQIRPRHLITLITTWPFNPNHISCMSA